MFFSEGTIYIYKTLSDISMKGLDNVPTISSNQGNIKDTRLIPSDSALNVNLVQSLILGSTLFILLTFLLFPNPLLNFIFESLTLSLF